MGKGQAAAEHLMCVSEARWPLSWDPSCHQPNAGSVSRCSPPGAPPTPQPCLGSFLFLSLRDMIQFLASEGGAFYFFPGGSPEKQGFRTKRPEYEGHVPPQQGSPPPQPLLF